jgi:hypothetical protein
MKEKAGDYFLMDGGARGMETMNKGVGVDLRFLVRLLIYRGVRFHHAG